MMGTVAADGLLVFFGASGLAVATATDDAFFCSTVDVAFVFVDTVVVAVLVAVNFSSSPSGVGVGVDDALSGVEVVVDEVALSGGIEVAVDDGTPLSGVELVADGVEVGGEPFDGRLELLVRRPLADVVAALAQAKVDDSAKHDGDAAEHGENLREPGPIARHDYVIP